MLILLPPVSTYTDLCVFKDLEKNYKTMQWYVWICLLARGKGKENFTVLFVWNIYVSLLGDITDV